MICFQGKRLAGGGWRRGSIYHQFSSRKSISPFRIGSFGPAARIHDDLSSTDWTGHIQTGPNESVIFIGNVLPVNFRWLPRIPYLNPRRGFEQLNFPEIENVSSASPLKLVERAIPEHLRPKVTEIIARYGEGGAFVKISHGEEPGAPKEVSRAVINHLKEDPIKPWFRGFKTVKAALVIGRPWIEDLYRLPSPRLKVEFLPTNPEASAVELTQETLYSLVRPYGMLGDIVAQPTDSKVLPRYALLDFTSRGYAVMVKNCLHGYVVSESLGGGKAGTLLRLTYERQAKGRWIPNWIFGHIRLVIAVIAGTLAAVTVFIFDPVRTLFIKARISPPLSFDENMIWQWVQYQATRANDIFWFGHQGAESSVFKAIWEDRGDDMQQIRNWLVEAAGTFIVVQGPRGSGKKELLLDGVLYDHKQKLVIDCKPIQEAQGDSAAIEAMAAQVGYWPVFSRMNSISSILDMATQNAIGAKAGLSQTLDTQLGNILQNTAAALKQIALEGRKKTDKDAHMTDDEYLEEHAECRPVLVIDNFLHKKDGNQIIYDKLADWAAALTNSNIARVVFLTTDAAYSKTLSRALPGQVFQQISLSDCTPEVAKRCVLSHLRSDDDVQGFKAYENEYMDELDECIGTLGGRLTDLEWLARVISRGERPKAAVRQIINQSTEEILKMFLANDHPESSGARQGDGAASQGWSIEQAWYLITKLGDSEDGTVRYDDILSSDIFKKGGEGAIRDLEQTELISVGTVNGRPSVIKPGKPVYSAGFKQLIQDDVLRSRLGMRVCGQLISMENATIAKYEEELQVLGSLPKQPREIRPRFKWLLTKLLNSQEKVERFEKEAAALKKILQEKD